ncbi:MAG: septum formation initiator family protein [Nocardioides sp.]|nr:septum formation initiator family protein [Nocardioides sp.]
MVVVVVSVLVVSYASSLKAYLAQRHDIVTLQTEITQRKAHIDELQKQTTRWQDPAYVQQQARARFGYVMPGETAYVALDEHGRRIQPQTSLKTPEEVGTPSTPKPWWDNAWGSVKLAGNPPEQATGPDEIGPHQ